MDYFHYTYKHNHIDFNSDIYIKQRSTVILYLYIIKIIDLTFLHVNYITAVIAAAKPKKIPGALANATGISLCSLNKP